MEGDMAPPQKRRKLSGPTKDGIAYPEHVTDDAPTPSFSHGIEHLPHTHPFSAPRQVPQRIEEVHLQIHQQAVSAPDHSHAWPRRQGTGSASEATLGVTIVASVDLGGSTSGLTTTTDAAATSGVSSFAATTTATIVSSPSASLSSSSSVDSSSSSSPADSSSATSSDSSTSTDSITSSDNSTESATSSDATTSSAPDTASGFIGNSPSAASATSTTGSGTGANDSATLTGSAASLSSGLGGSGSASVNLTTSALIIQGSSTTYTSLATIDLSNSTRSGSASPTSHANSHTSGLGAAFFLTTLGDGVVETLSRSNRPYATTFADGRSLTVPAASGSYVTTTGSDGATSTLYETTMATGSSYEQSTITSTAMGTAAGVGEQGTPTSSATTSTSSAHGGGGGGGGNSASAPPGTIAGGVVGGAAGLAVILLIAMLFLRWYRRRAQAGHQALPPNAGVSLSLDPDQQGAAVTRGPGMAERAGIMPVLGAVPALFRHQNRSTEGSDSTERGFQRVSGRKLPSNFSPGMSSSPPPTMPLSAPDQNMSSTSFYRDSAGFYGGEGIPATPVAGDREEMTLSPGPQRRPTVHAGGPYTMSPTSTTPNTPRPWTDTAPNSPSGTAGTTATFDRSDTPSSLDPNRSSRFTEEV